MFTVCIMESYFALRRRYPTLRLTSKLVDLRVGYAKWIRRTKFAEPHLTQLRKYDARCCIILTEGYRSGHNEAVLKTRAQKFLLFPQNPCNIKGFRHFPSYKNFIVLSRNSLQIPEHFAKDTLRRVIEVVITRRS